MKRLRGSLAIILVIVMVIGTQSITVLANEEENTVVGVENAIESEENDKSVEAVDVQAVEQESTEVDAEQENIEQENIEREDEQTDVEAGIEIYAAEDVVASGTCGDNLTWALTEDGAMTISGTGDMWDYDSESGMNPSFTMQYSEQIKRVIIESGITGIGDYAFSYCHGLIQIEMPEGIKRIGKGAFVWCEQLRSIKIPSSVTNIGASAFSHCESLDKIEIPEGITQIEDFTFYGCKELVDIEIPNGIKNIGGWAFDNCASLTEITLPEGLASIGANAFSGCGALEIKIPDSVECIDIGAFRRCSLKRVILPNRITEIGDYVFDHCEALEQIEIPKSVRRIGYGAFDTCSSLKEIIIPSSVMNIGDGAFWGCSSLKDVHFDGDAPEFEGDEPNTFLMVTANVYYPENNSAWTVDKMQNYGGTLTWFSWNLYIVEEATDSVYVKGSSNGATIKCTEELGKFISVAVDGVIVDSSNYMVVEGSTVLTFLSSYLDTLSVGDHVVTLNYTYGSVDSRLTVLENGANLNTPANETDTSGNAGNANGGSNTGKNGSMQGGVPKTGDNTSMMLWLLVALVAGSGCVVLLYMKRKIYLKF